MHCIEHTFLQNEPQSHTSTILCIYISELGNRRISTGCDCSCFYFFICTFCFYQSVFVVDCPLCMQDNHAQWIGRSVSAGHIPCTSWNVVVMPRLMTVYCSRCCCLLARSMSASGPAAIMKPQPPSYARFRFQCSLYNVRAANMLQI